MKPRRGGTTHRLDWLVLNGGVYKDGGQEFSSRNGAARAGKRRGPSQGQFAFSTASLRYLVARSVPRAGSGTVYFGRRRNVALAAAFSPSPFGRRKLGEARRAEDILQRARARERAPNEHALLEAEVEVGLEARQGKNTSKARCARTLGRICQEACVADAIGRRRAFPSSLSFSRRSSPPAGRPTGWRAG